jgi:hypothetical protein
MEGYIAGRRKRGRSKRRWAQDIIDKLQISALDAGHLAYDRAVFRKVLKGAKFHELYGKNRLNTQ